MSRPAELFVTATDYLARERQAETRNEHLNGCIYANRNPGHRMHPASGRSL